MKIKEQGHEILLKLLCRFLILLHYAFENNSSFKNTFKAQQTTRMLIMKIYLNEVLLRL